MEIIKIQELKFKWAGQQENLLDIQDLTIRQGERLFLKGASGSGKSSLLGLLAGINIPQYGNIIMLGQSVNGMKATARDQFRSDHIGFIFQMFNLVPYLSVIENVVMPCHFSRKRYQKIAQSFRELSDEALRLLDHVGLSGNDVLNKPVTELSVGQQQRVAACRALIGKPEIIIADEPTSSLDEDAQLDFINLLSDECERNDMTLVFVSHDTRFAPLFGKNAKLKNGHIVMESQKGKGGVL